MLLRLVCISSNSLFKKRNCTSSDIVALVPTGDAMVSKLSAKIEPLGYSIQTYESDSVVDEEIKNGKKICFGVSFINDGTNYKYSIRGDINEGFIDSSAVLTSDRAIDVLSYASVVTSGMVGMVTVINSLIFQAELGTSFTIVNKMAPIYQ